MHERPDQAAALAALVLLAGCADPGGVCPPPKEVSDIPLLRMAGQETVPVEINGQPAGMWLDTGAGGTTVTPQAVADLGLNSSRMFLRTGGIGGEANNAAVEIASLEVGGSQVSDAVALEVPLSEATLDKLPTYGLLGQDIMTHWDLDLDSAHDHLALYRPQHCAVPTAPWSGAVTAVPLQHDYQGLRIRFPVVLDGHTVTAALDTGASRSAVIPDALDLDRAMLAVDQPAHLTGINVRRVPSRRHHFAHLQIAGTDFGPVILDVGAFQLGDVDMLLGEDFLRRHRVYMAFQSQTLLIANTSE